MRLFVVFGLAWFLIGNLLVYLSSRTDCLTALILYLIISFAAIHHTTKK